VAPFKKGPDYIDAAWLTTAAGRPCRNLDLFFMSGKTVERSFLAAASGQDVAVIEGNRGLYDGLDAHGSCSTAELAKLLQVPVVLVVDCTKATRTIAAVVLGCQRLDPGVAIRGVILNLVAGSRHESVLREAVEEACGLPVLGAIPRMAEELLPERHLGLVPPQEHGGPPDAIQRMAEVAKKHLNLPAIWRVAEEAAALGAPLPVPITASESRPRCARIGVFRDAAFQFYYPENLEALEREGAQLVEISPLHDPQIPDVDALYLGGGFPETLATSLAQNRAFLDSLRRLANRGLPIYAECGGAVFLGEKLLVDQQRFAMAGVLPVTFAFGPRPQGHGYTVLEAVRDNPFFAVGETLRGHEFHYTYVQSPNDEDLTFAFRVHRGHGIDGRQDGLCHRNTLACYTHVHALGTEEWAPSVVRRAAEYRRAQR